MHIWKDVLPPTSWFGLIHFMGSDFLKEFCFSSFLAQPGVTFQMCSVKLGGPLCFCIVHLKSHCCI